MKNILRKQAICQRKNMDLLEISRQICDNITSLLEYKNSENVGIFHPKEIEINLLPLCKNKSKVFYMPKIQNDKMEFYKYTGENDLKPGKYDIFEPTSNIMTKKLDVVITPALMADRKGYRLGWGGGFYDKFLQNYEGIIICPIPACQLTEELPVEKHDIKSHFIVTEKEIIKII